MINIKIILGSTRPNRFGPQPAEWINSLAQAHKEATFELVDLKEFNLPLLDEPVPALMGQYSQEHTKVWSKLVANADGFIFVAPEYNHGVSGALKNAIDFLAAEWNYKPVTFVSYGADAGGTRAVEQLRQIVGQLKMYDLSEVVSIPNYWSQLNREGKFAATEAQAHAAEKLLKGIIFWAENMKTAREELRKSEQK